MVINISDRLECGVCSGGGRGSCVEEAFVAGEASLVGPSVDGY